jgi:hypothetical protein
MVTDCTADQCTGHVVSQRSLQAVTTSLGRVIPLIAEMLPAQVGLLKETLGAVSSDTRA